MSRYRYLLLLMLVAHSAGADGGRLRLHERAGPFVVTLFTSPDPLTEGRADFSVAIERAGNLGLVQDAEVTLILRPADEPEKQHGQQLEYRASPESATSRFLQAANVSLPGSGNWIVTVAVKEGGAAGQCSGTIEVFPSRAGGNSLFCEIAVVPIMIFFFAIHQYRKAIRSRQTQRRGLAGR